MLMWEEGESSDATELNSRIFVYLWYLYVDNDFWSLHRGATIGPTQETRRTSLSYCLSDFILHFASLYSM